MLLKKNIREVGLFVSGSARKRLSARPQIDMSKKFQADMSAYSPSNISPNP